MRYLALVTVASGTVEAVTLASKTAAAARELLAEVYPDTTAELYEWPRNLSGSSEIIGLIPVKK